MPALPQLQSCWLLRVPGGTRTGAVLQRPAPLSWRCGTPAFPSAACAGGEPRFLQLLGELMAGPDLRRDPVLDLGRPWDVLRARQEEGRARLPGAAPAGRGTRRGLCGHMQGPNKPVPVTGEAAGPALPAGSGIGAGSGT